MQHLGVQLKMAVKQLQPLTVLLLHHQVLELVNLNKIISCKKKLSYKFTRAFLCLNNYLSNL